MDAPHPFLDHPLPLAFAHRGGSLEVEENTLAAFAHAVSLGYSHVETDVQATRDGVAVIFHDDTLTRMTGEEVRVDALTWPELKARRTKGGNPIPRLDEVLASWPGLPLAAGTGGRAGAVAAWLGAAGSPPGVPCGAGAGPAPGHSRRHPPLRAGGPCGGGAGPCLDGGRAGGDGAASGVGRRRADERPADAPRRGAGGAGQGADGGGGFPFTSGPGPRIAAA